MCLIHLTGPDSLSMHGDLNHFHVGHRTVSFGYMNNNKKATAFYSRSKQKLIKITNVDEYFISK